MRRIETAKFGVPPAMTDPSAHTLEPVGLKMAKAPFSDTVLVCGKCARKLKGAGKPIAKALKGELKSRRWGRVRVVETRCFDLCPKRRQVLASHRTLADRRLLVVEPGFSPEDALVRLLGPPLRADAPQQVPSQDPAEAADADLKGM